MDSDNESTHDEEDPNREQVYYCIDKCLARVGHDRGVLVEGRLIATYGGGPEGGWFTYECGEEKYLFRVHRTWGTCFVLDKPLTGELHFELASDGSDWVAYHGEEWTQSYETKLA